MDVGTFSFGLTVKNIETSLSYYKTLGFKIIDSGRINEGFKDNDVVKWRILENLSVKIGLFQGMFEHNILTFNPKDVLCIQDILKEGDIRINSGAKENDHTKSIIFLDQDENRIMLDQHLVCFK